jgi:hypothetical protein
MLHPVIVVVAKTSVLDLPHRESSYEQIEDGRERAGIGLEELRMLASLASYRRKLSTLHVEYTA